MKNLIIISAILIFIILSQVESVPVNNTNYFDLCALQNKRDEMIGKLTPEGQQSVRKILYNFQYAVLNSIKPLIKLATSEATSALFLQSNLQNNQAFKTFLSFLTFGLDVIPIQDTGKLIDLCNYQSLANTFINAQSVTSTQMTNNNNNNNQMNQNSLLNNLINSLLPKLILENSNNQNLNHN
jgi:hypothetical protein